MNYVRRPVVVFWQVLGRNQSGFVVKYWTKPGNELTLTTTELTEERLQCLIEDATGRKRFDLEEVK